MLQVTVPMQRQEDGAAKVAETKVAAVVQKEKGKNTNGKGCSAEKQCIVDIDDDDDDSDIEDVTEFYTSKKPRASQEVINVEDVSSDDDNDGSCVMESHWGYDEYGKMIRSDGNSQHKTAHAKQKYASDASSRDIESISSDSDSSSGVEDVTEIMMAKRKEQAQKMIDDAEEIYDSDGDCSKDQRVVRKKRNRSRRSQPAAKKRKTKKVEPPIEVFIDDKDIPLCPGAKSRQEQDDATLGGNEVDHSIKQRIVKLLNTGFHGESNEHEARNAMKLARRLMERHNLDQAVLLQERGDGSLNDFSTNNDEGSSLAGGFVIVKFRNRKKSKSLSSLPRWHEYLVQTVCMNFHVEAFKTLERSTLWRAGESSVTFYGIRTNAQLAAYAFKIASERIALMAATYEPPRNDNLPRAKQIAEKRTARLSYALGVVKGLERDVQDGLEKEEAKRKANLRKAQREAKGGEAYHEDSRHSDNDDQRDSSFDCADENGDFGKTANDKVDHPKLSHEGTNSNAVDHYDKLERENTAHLALVDHHKNIASDVLKSKNVKVRKARKHKSITLNRKAYEKGVIDSKEVDLNQKAIRD